MNPRRTLAILGAALLGFGAGALVTGGGTSAHPPGLEATRTYEDGSWAMRGCLPSAPCSLPRR